MANLAPVDDFPDNASATLTHSSSSPRSPGSTTFTSASDTPFIPQGAAQAAPQAGGGGGGGAPPNNPPFTLDELDDDRVVEGWPLLAKIMARKPHLEIFHRFRELNAKNLLYYQVELDVLSTQLKEQENDDWNRHRHTTSTANYAKFADTMIRHGKNVHGSHKSRKQWGLVLDIRKLLKEYNAALLQQAQISALHEPTRRDVNFLGGWLFRTDGGNFCIGGAGSEVWGPPQRAEARASVPRRLLQFVWNTLWSSSSSKNKTDPDLVAIQPQRNIDGLTRWIEEELLPCYHDCMFNPNKGETRKNDVERPGQEGKEKAERDEIDQRLGMTCDEYSEKAIVRFTASVATIIACILPTVAIGVLTTANGTMAKLLYIGGFTALFSIGLMYLTSDASRLQVFTAAAAFSAVLVVFVQGA